MSQEELKDRLLSDLSQINLPIDEVDLFIRPFSKTYYGRYFPVYNDEDTKPKIYVYPYVSADGDSIDYDMALKTAIHEFCHHIQYTSGSFVRSRGVMHDPQFWKLYNFYENRALNSNLIEEEEREVVQN